MKTLNATDLQSRAQAALASSPFYELRNLRVEQHCGGLLISGAVSSFYYKQIAQEVVRAVCKDQDIELVNSIRVH